MTERSVYPAVVECRSCGERIGTTLERRPGALGGTEPAVVKCPSCGHLNQVKLSPAEEQSLLKGEEMFLRRV